jgi:hypothetical protein
MGGYYARKKDDRARMGGCKGRQSAIHSSQRVGSRGNGTYQTGKHGARSTNQAIAIGLSKARRAGIKLPPPKNKKGTAQDRTRAQAARKLCGRTSVTAEEGLAEENRAQSRRPLNARQDRQPLIRVFHTRRTRLPKDVALRVGAWLRRTLFEQRQGGSQKGSAKSGAQTRPESLKH